VESQTRATSRGEPRAETSNGASGEASPLVAGLVLLAVLLLYFWLSGALFSDDMSGFWMSSAQTSGMSLTYSTSPAFMVASLLYARRRTRVVVDRLVESKVVDQEAARTAHVGAQVLGRGVNVGLVIIGILLGSTNVSWDMVAKTLDGPWAWTGVSMAVGNFVTWIAVVQVFARRYIASRELHRLGRDHARVDLLRPDQLLPFGAIGILHFLMVVVTISLSSFQSLDAELRWVNYSAALAAGVPAAIVLLSLPMIGIRQNVRRAKSISLGRLDDAIARASRDLEPDSLRYLGDLVRQRDAVTSGREWPLDTTAVSRIAIYVVIPPIAWVGGALVEILVESAL